MMTMTPLGVVVPAFVSGIHLHIFTYWAIIGVCHGLRYQTAFVERDRRAVLLELRASEIKIELRHAQLHVAAHSPDQILAGLEVREIAALDHRRCLCIEHFNSLRPPALIPV